MRKIGLTTVLFLATLSAAMPALASTATDFYLELLRRGTTEVDGGRFDTALTPLRLAAFGLVDSIEHYETAQAYLAVAHDRLGQEEEARRAALRVVTAEGIERKFATLRLPAAIRNAFSAVARKVLSSAEAAALTSPPQTALPPSSGSSSTQTSAPRPVVSQPAPQTQTPRTQPQTPTTQTAPAQSTTTGRPAPDQDTRSVTFPEPQRVEPPKVSETPTPTAPAQTQSRPQTQTPTQSVPPARIDPPKVIAAPQQRNDPPKVVSAPPKPQPEPARPQQVQVPIQTQPVRDVPARIAAGERALATANLTEARRVYRELLTVPSLDRASIIRIGEGLYRARDFAQALAAFRRLGALRAGEEAYRYYIAVALFETADFAAAKRELASALPFIEITPDVQRYRVKIEGARN